MVASEKLILAREGERGFDAYLARPESGRGIGIIFLHDMFGMNTVFFDLCERYARQGVCALLPNQFWRSEPSGPLPHVGGHERAWQRLASFDYDACTRGMQLSIDWLRRQPFCTGKVAAVGFCFAGRLAYLAAARTDIDAAAGLYSLGISKHLDEVGRIKCPLQIHYGLADTQVPQAEVDIVSAGVAGRANIEVFTYPGAGHSFCNPIRPTYDPQATALAERRIDAMLAKIA